MILFSGDFFNAAAAEPLVRFGVATGVLLWGLLSLRGGRPVAVVLFGALLTGLVYGYWMMALPRPYGMLTDPHITERMATASAIASTGDPTQTSHSKDPNPHPLRDWVLAVLNPEPRTLMAVFRLGPVLLAPLLALVL